jgi:hypothetical protein
MSEKKLKIICDGDSWTFGSEIADPKISMRYDGTVHPGKYDWLEENDDYRLPKIFPTHLANLLDAEVINLSWPADDNGTIVNRIVTYITSNYISKGLATDDLFVIVGWSSPERHFFWYKDEEFSGKFRLWPQVQHFDRPPQKDFWDLYVTYLWNAEEYLPRFVMNVVQLQNFCVANNIKWMCYNSFYQTPGRNPEQWDDLDIRNELSKLHLHGTPVQVTNVKGRDAYQYEYVSLWDTVDKIRFYKKDEPNNTFKSFMEENNQINPYNGWHPSPESHEIWAKELVRYIKENNLI